MTQVKLFMKFWKIIYQEKTNFVYKMTPNTGVRHPLIGDGLLLDILQRSAQHTDQTRP